MQKTEICSVSGRFPDNLGELTYRITILNPYGILHFDFMKLIKCKNIFTADRDELMKERVRFEKEKRKNAKGGESSKDQRAKQKRKLPEDGRDSQKKKTQKRTEEDKVKEQKAKEREEKKKKKDEDQQRQKYLLEARKAQAASRWATSDSQTEEEVVIFTPEPVRQTNISPSCQSLIEMTPPAQHSLDSTNSQDTNTERISQTPRTKKTSPATSCQSSKQPTTPAQLTLHVPSTDRNQTANIRDASQTVDRTPVRPSNAKRTSEPRRGLHFQSAAAESSDDEISEGSEDNPEQGDIISDGSSNCCKEKRLEIEALRKRLEKLHKRLNISCKFPCMYTILQL